jgi:hypothetical protein
MLVRLILRVKIAVDILPLTVIGTNAVWPVEELKPDRPSTAIDFPYDSSSTKQCLVRVLVK